MKPIKDTELLLNEIKETASIYEFLENNSSSLLDRPMGDYLDLLLKKYQMNKTKLQYEAGFSRQYLYEVYSGAKKMSRNKVLNIVFSLHTTLVEAQNLLKYSGNSQLYAKDMKDSILIFCIQKKMSLIEVNDILFELAIDTLE
ncbi:MAG: hypothetical protein JW708_04890 [Vallitaleaceae bacterium]|nr:hypothetical protein [Vallitaleaceae bacterium]